MATFDHPINIFPFVDLTLNKPPEFPLRQVKLSRYLTLEPIVHPALAVAQPGTDAGAFTMRHQIEHGMVLAFRSVKPFGNKRRAKLGYVQLSHFRRVQPQLPSVEVAA